VVHLDRSAASLADALEPAAIQVAGPGQASVSFASGLSEDLAVGILAAFSVPGWLADRAAAATRRSRGRTCGRAGTWPLR
jgi:hypothetical protein